MRGCSSHWIPFKLELGCDEDSGQQPSGNPDGPADKLLMSYSYPYDLNRDRRGEQRSVLMLAASGDVRMLARGGISGRRRITRHLRPCALDPSSRQAVSS